MSNEQHVFNKHNQSDRGNKPRLMHTFVAGCTSAMLLQPLTGEEINTDYLFVAPGKHQPNTLCSTLMF